MTYLILHDIRSAHNVGSIFRTADAAGVEKIFLTGYTPAPVDRFCRARKDVAKSALGAEKTVPWESAEDYSGIIANTRIDGFEIIALEQAKNSVDYKKYKPKKDFVLIVGNEVDGLPEDILKLCDKIIEIPMKGKLARNRLPDDGGKESLNVAVALGIALFRILL